jgi:GNAT superfamily N-acetyltransferase
MCANQANDTLQVRLAISADLPALKTIMKLAIDVSQRDFLTPVQVAASHGFMGLDTQLVDDGTYFVVEIGGTIAGCGGWSRRATLFGGDHSAGLRDSRLLDATTEAARVRAMYTHPDFARRGIGRLILQQCEAAAAAEGFARVELMATLAGEPLYAACGYREIERTSTRVDGHDVPVVRMGKALPAIIDAHQNQEGTIQ